MTGRGSPRRDACPVSARGLALREVCARCPGRPTSGQFTHARGGVLFLEGEPAEHVVAVVSGWLREVRTTADGRAQPVRLVRPGELAGLEALTTGYYHTTLEALTPVVSCHVPAGTVRALLAQAPERAAPLLAEALAELQAVRDAVLWVGAFTAEERVEALLLRLTDHGVPGAWVELPLSRLEMAELLGLAHATVSRIVQRMVRAGLLEVRGRRVRRSLERARAPAQGPD